MKSKILVVAAVNAAILSLGSAAFAQTQGTPPTVTGQPNAYGNIDSSASTYTQTAVTGGDITLALDVTPHVYSGENINLPQLVVNSPGVGVYNVASGTGGDGRSFWNYDFAITAPLNSTYTYLITIFNVNTGIGASFDPINAPGIGNHIIGTTQGNSESFDFSNGATPFPGAIGYNPDANGTYTVTLTADGANGQQVASDTITINAAPDVTSTMGLMSMGLAALGLVSRRFRK